MRLINGYNFVTVNIKLICAFHNLYYELIVYIPSFKKKIHTAYSNYAYM